MKILITGFEPFGRWQRNPSGETAQHFAGMTLNGVQITSARLPVSFQRAAAPLTAAIDTVRPDVVLSLGLGAPGEVRVERIAVNCCEAPPGGDNDGYSPGGAPIERGGPETYSSTLPVARIIDRIASLGFRVVPSNSAGEYLCNFAMYTSLHHINTHHLPIRAGFIHGPQLPSERTEESEEGAMSLEEWITFTQAAIEVLRETQ